jgi:hypothetical protein
MEQEDHSLKYDFENVQRWGWEVAEVSQVPVTGVDDRCCEQVFVDRMLRHVYQMSHHLS